MEVIWKDVQVRAKNFVKKPDRFLCSKDSEEFDKSKILLKVLYDGTKMCTGDSNNIEELQKTMPELVIDDFDEEQIWAGVELQNKIVYDDCQDRIAEILSLSKNAFDFFVPNNPQEKEQEIENDLEDSEEDDFDMKDVAFDQTTEKAFVSDESGNDDNENDSMKQSGDEESGSEDEDKDEADEIFNDPDFQNMSDSDLDDKLPLFDKTDSEDSDDEDNNQKEQNGDEKAEAEERELENKTSDYMANAMKAMKSNTKRSEIEDNFFRLDDMEKFLDGEDAKAMRESKSDPNEDQEDGIDYFASDLDGEDDENDDLGDDKASKVMYKDFFDAVDGSLSKKEITKNLLESDDEDKDSNEEAMGEMKSSHEMRTDRLQKKIKEMEKKAVHEKPWQMTGEVAALERPDNALLQEHLDFDTVSKSAPIITEEVSKKLEDIIKQRIKDLAWDDVERKVKPVENPYDYKKKLILDQEKSKLSLAQVYEEEYLKQKGELESSKKTPGN